MPSSPLRSALAEYGVYLRSLWGTPAAFRPHLVEAVGLWSRGARQAQAWGPHLERTRETIASRIEAVSPRRTVAVLGSGPLFDVPLDELSRAFGRVLLIDLAHLATIDTALRRAGNVERVWRDLAPEGVGDPLAFLRELPDLDWVISVNLLSQIGRAAPRGSQGAVIAAHLESLSRLPIPVTVVTDVDYRVLDHAGAVIEAEDLMHGVSPPRHDKSWLWEVAPFGEEDRQTRRVHTVLAFPDWHAACRRPV
jgi:hypothetical protein